MSFIETIECLLFYKGAIFKLRKQVFTLAHLVYF